ncbi:MAG TPA: efflux RND transporter periplasmic adaptor subunit [Candidatus Acidoferrales bacterium]|nr:efflux RND transporter periplasmic adaptor subunit [Candidatus Acidoferrales bacterium]
MRTNSLGLAPALFAAVMMSFSGCSKPTLPAAGPPDVEVVEVIKKDVPVTREWVATLQGTVNAQIRAQVAGILLKQQYVNGAVVKAGDPLFQIDPRPFQAALDGASANLQQAKANLDRAQAQSGKTQMDVDRYTPLAKESAISQQELDDAIQNNLAAKAQVEQSKAAIDSAQAAVENARLNFGFTRITSPIDGVTAIAVAQVGDLVGPQSGALTTVSWVNPITVSFTVSEQDYLGAVRVAVKMGLSQEEVLSNLDWHLKLADGTMYPQVGHFSALDRQVDIRTGAIEVQVRFPNQGNILRPGGFGRISSVVRIEQGAVVIPQRAVTEMQGGYLVAVVGSDNKAAIRTVKMGDKSGGMWIVLDGLKPGERVVAEGTQKIQEGAVVNPKPYKPAAVPGGDSASSGGAS